MSRLNGHTDGGEDNGDWFSLDDFVESIDTDNRLIDELHALKFGEQPRGLGWAWNEAELVAPSTVRINGAEYTFDPLTRELRER